MRVIYIKLDVFIIMAEIRELLNSFFFHPDSVQGMGGLFFVSKFEILGEWMQGS